MNNKCKDEVIEFNEWLFKNNYVPNSSFLWFKYSLPEDDIRFFELEFLYDIFLREKEKQINNEKSD